MATIRSAPLITNKHTGESMFTVEHDGLDYVWSSEWHCYIATGKIGSHVLTKYQARSIAHAEQASFSTKHADMPAKISGDPKTGREKGKEKVEQTSILAQFCPIHRNPLKQTDQSVNSATCRNDNSRELTSISEHLSPVLSDEIAEALIDEATNYWHLRYLWR